MPPYACPATSRIRPGIFPALERLACTHRPPSGLSLVLGHTAPKPSSPFPACAHVKILFVSSEVTPFSKTGGLADVSGALPRELARLGHEVRIVTPKYASIDDDRFHLLPILDEIIVRLGGRDFYCQIHRTLYPESQVPVYFVREESLFGREGLYQEAGADYEDNAVRFAVFSTAAAWLLKALDWTPDVIHCNDWQTALLPVYLRVHPYMKEDPQLSSIRTVFTIHNLAYQGVFPAATAAQLDVGPAVFHPAGLEYYGKLNLLKGALQFADWITTVSPRYASEILTADYGFGLEGVLQQRRQRLTGILNGIDWREWNPEADPHLPASYSAADMAAKAVCKSALQKELGLKPDPTAPLLGIVSRIDPQKGLDLVADAAPALVAAGAQLAILGTGHKDLEKKLAAASKKHKGAVAVSLQFDNGLAHRIEAGADFFLMPSRFEPCGLNQMYSLRYGTVPIVRETGGLADSVREATPQTITDGTGTGFLFKPFTSVALMAAVRRALDIYADKPRFDQLRRNGMVQDFSWERSAREYAALYERLSA